MAYSVAKPALRTNAILENAVRDTSAIKLIPMTGTRHRIMVRAIKSPPLTLAIILSIVPKFGSAGFSIQNKNTAEIRNPVATLAIDNFKSTESTVRYCSQKSKGIPVGQI